jgi:hypothetical protein
MEYMNLGKGLLVALLLWGGVRLAQYIVSGAPGDIHDKP